MLHLLMPTARFCIFVEDKIYLPPTDVAVTRFISSVKQFLLGIGAVKNMYCNLSFHFSFYFILYA